MALVSIEVHGEETVRYLGQLKAALWPRAFRDAGKEIGREALREFRRTTSTWKHKPEFTEMTEVTDRELTVLVGTDDTIYGYLDRGTRGPYPIVPKRPGYPLRFASGYNAKTTPGIIGSHAGGPFGETVTAWAVMHPGIEARDFTGMIQRYMDTKARDIIERHVEVLMRKRYL